jgi:hypothetical protein
MQLVGDGIILKGKRQKTQPDRGFVKICYKGLQIIIKANETDLEMNGVKGGYRAVLEIFPTTKKMCIHFYKTPECGGVKVRMEVNRTPTITQNGLAGLNQYFPEEGVEYTLPFVPQAATVGAPLADFVVSLP